MPCLSCFSISTRDLLVRSCAHVAQETIGEEKTGGVDDALGALTQKLTSFSLILLSDLLFDCSLDVRCDMHSFE